MNEKELVEKARERVIDTIARNMNLYGVTESVGRLYGSLYFHETPMTLDEMKEELGMSKTSMSTAVRALMEQKMVEKVWKKGARKDLFRAEADWYQTFTDLFTVKWRVAVHANVTAIKKSMLELSKLLESENMEADAIEEAERDMEKLSYALEYYDWLDRLVKSFETKEIFNYIPKVDNGKKDTDLR